MRYRPPSPWRSVRDRSLLLLCIWFAASCGVNVDRLLEGPAPSDARLAVGLDTSVITVPQGGTLAVTATVTRIGDFNGPVTLTIERAPDGITSAVGNPATSGQLTTATLTLRIGDTAPLGTYTLLVRGHADGLTDATTVLIVTVTVPPAYSIALSAPTITIARGGIGRVSVTVTRTNLPAPVTLAIAGAAGITAAFATNPVTGATADATLSVALDVAPGSYAMTVRGSAAGLADRTTPINVIVTADPLQLITGAVASVAPLGAVSTDIIINRGGFSGAVTLTAENLPLGVVASFQPALPTGNSTTLTLTAGPTAAAGTRTITVRGKGQGIPDATADIVLTVAAAGISLAIDPAAVSVFQGASATPTLSIVRTAFTGAVAITVEGAPAGLTVTPDVLAAGATSVLLTVAATSTLAPGTYPLVVRGSPVGLGSAASATVALGVTVRAAPLTGGNVLLDWSGCTVPQWVAGQDGADPWQQLSATAGTFRFAVNSGKGGFAYAEAGNTVTVRYMTQAELSASAINMCGSASPTKTVFGTGDHTAPAQQWFYYLGGGSGSSTTAQPNFSIVGVQNGVQDLIGWTVFGVGYHGVIRRDLNLPDGGSVGIISLVGAESFAATQKTLTFGGTTASAEQIRQTMTYLTTPACVANTLYTVGPQGQTAAYFGVPEPMQRATDFHQLTVVSATSSGTRSITTTFHTITDRFVAMPPVITSPTLQSLSGPFKRVQATIGDLPAGYNGSVRFTYAEGSRSITLAATVGYTGSSGVVLAMPDLSVVSGWPNTFAVTSGATVSWNFTLDGASTPGPVCTEGRTTIQATRQGIF